MSWWSLTAIKQTQRDWERSYYSLPPDACPNDCTPLEYGFNTLQGGGKQQVRHCPMGDYIWASGRRLT